ncbi:uncharacterized protein LOC125705993 [Brienomyrus brachyistius]|uniref:uncharacterized protein LOC125705993 n=1 Tax=Brienomyrus brachyistius TaxID=42636 RepID=UPI0020B2E853|nr:uncharacterized protein LOC125705993 [Brienomyrus brachyistius]
MFKIVEFKETNEVELVPGVWVKDGVCHWPPYKGKQLDSAIKHQVTPDHSWIQWEVRVMFITESYEEGRRKLREAEQRSDLQSEAEESGKKKRRKMPSSRLLDATNGASSESEEEAGLQQSDRRLPEAPPISQVKILTPLQTANTGSRSTIPWLKNPPLPLEMMWQPTDALRGEHDLNKNRADLFSSPPPHPEPSKVQKSWIPSEVNQFHQDHAKTWTPPSQLQRTPAEVPQFPQGWANSFTQQQSLQQPPRVWSNQTSSEALIREVLTKQEMILEQQTFILRLLQARQNTQDCEIEEGLLPVHDIEALQNVEVQLSNGEFKERLMNHLSLIGGCDIKDAVWRLMRKTISNSLARNMNWKGLNGKTSFAALRLKDVMIAAVRKNPLMSKATDHDVESVMKRWLQLALDREGGRKRRQKTDS